MRGVATPPPCVAGGAAAADACGRANEVGVAAGQQGRNVLFLSGERRSWRGLFASLLLYHMYFFSTFFCTAVLRWQAPRLFAALAPSLVNVCKSAPCVYVMSCPVAADVQLAVVIGCSSDQIASTVCPFVLLTR